MDILSIYKLYGIPNNLIDHMLRVSACANLIIDNWNGPVINTDELIRVLLLHDMGNIVKVKEQYQDVTFNKKRDVYLSVYGNDDHLVSLAIASELGLSDDEKILMAEKVFVNNEFIFKSDNYTLKIAAYCDQRVAPDGVYPILDRLMEAKERYKDKPGTSMNNPKTDELIKLANQIEDQIFKHTKGTPDDINNESIKEYVNKLKRYKISR